MRSDKEWTYWGKTDPFWGVASVPGKRKADAHPWTAEEFLESGAVAFGEVLPIWRSYGMGREHCIEIGCGSGRITNQLLTVFERVTALDVSAEQIENAKRLLGSKAGRVHFVLVTEPEIPLADGEADAMFSCQVFQHFARFDGVARYLRSAFAKLKPGSTVAFEAPVLGMQSRLSAWYSCRRLLAKAARGVGRRSVMEYQLFRAPQIFKALRDCGYVDCELRVCVPEGQPVGRSRFFARKPAR